MWYLIFLFSTIMNILTIIYPFLISFDVRFNILRLKGSVTIKIFNKIKLEFKIRIKNGYEVAKKIIAENFSNNVRELEGAFTRVCAYAEVSEQELTLDLAREVLKCSGNSQEISFDKIARVTASYYDVDMNDIKGTARGQKVSLARHTSIYLCRDITNQSFVNIAKYYGKKHTTIMFAYDKIKKEKNTNPEISTALREIRQVLKVL